MAISYLIEQVLTNPLLIFFFYSCFATLAVCIAYFIDDELRGFLDAKREQRELQERSTRSIDAVVDELYAS